MPVLCALAAPGALLFLQGARPYVRVRDQERVLPLVSAGTLALAPPGGSAVCASSAAGVQNEVVPGGGSLAPEAFANPSAIAGGFSTPARAAFFAQVTGSPRNQGIFVHDGTQLVPIAVGCGGPGGSGVAGSGCGDPTPVGGTFGGFFGGTPFVPAVNERGDVLFLAEVEGGSAPLGLFLHHSATQTIVKVVAVGDAAPGGGSFRLVGPGSLNELGEVAFLASTESGGASDVFLWSAGSVSKVAAVGDPAPLGGSYQLLGTESIGMADGTIVPTGPVPALDDQGTVVFRAIVTGGSVTRGYVRTRRGAASSWLVSAGETTLEGGSFVDFPAAPILNEAGECAFFADYQPSPGTFNSAWFVGTRGRWRKALAFGDGVAGGQVLGLAFSRNPLTPLDDQGNLLLWADVMLAAGNFKEHLVVRTRDGALVIAARKGDATPLGGFYNGFDAWPALDRHGRGVLGALIPGATGGVQDAHVVFRACPHASASARLGSGANAPCFQSSRPVLGTSWQSTVAAAFHPGATLTVIVGYLRPLGGRPLASGEALVDPASLRLFRSLAAPGVGGDAVHAVALPPSLALLGLRGYLQAGIVGGGPELCNAVDVVFGL
jgi:hypothetical protein